MTYLFWTAPTLAVIAVIASGRLGTLGASLVGLSLAVVVALTTAPHAFTVSDALVSLARGAWIGWIVIPYILGGLLFWQMAVRPGDAAMPAETSLPDEHAKRRLLFAACFLIGPFAEAATGFGVGIIGTMTLVRRLNVPPISLLVFGLLSQTLILWGGMGSGAILGAAFSRTDPTTLTLNTSPYVIAFNLLWLAIYWRIAGKAGIAAGWRERISEALWLCASLAGAIVATALLGPETALLAAYGPAIVLRYLLDGRPDRRELVAAVHKTLPFAILIGWLVVTRSVPPLTALLAKTGSVQPFAGAPTWSPLLHAGTWLVVAALATGLLRGHSHQLLGEAGAAWKTGRLAVLSIIAFAMLAETMSGSGIAAGLAKGLHDALGRWAVALIPIVSALFGALANTGSAANGLFMPPLLSLAAESGLNVAPVIALQHAGALSLNIVSPVRMTIACTLAGTPGREREAYRVMLPFIAAVFLVLLPCAVLIASGVFQGH